MQSWTMPDPRYQALFQQRAMASIVLQVVFERFERTHSFLLLHPGRTGAKNISQEAIKQQLRFYSQPDLLSSTCP